MTKRSDYNVMHRINRVQLLDNGFQHMQENAKIIRKKGLDDRLLVWERGANLYETLLDWPGAIHAKKWWQNESVFWGKARTAWSQILSTSKGISIKKSQKNTVSLGERLNTLSRKTSISTDEIKKEILNHVETI